VSRFGNAHCAVSYMAQSYSSTQLDQALTNGWSPTEAEIKKAIQLCYFFGITQCKLTGKLTLCEITELNGFTLQLPYTDTAIST
jgi:hypothetical protein